MRTVMVSRLVGKGAVVYNFKLCVTHVLTHGGDPPGSPPAVWGHP
jgi:hypothetical protein